MSSTTTEQFSQSVKYEKIKSLTRHERKQVKKKTKRRLERAQQRASGASEDASIDNSSQGSGEQKHLEWIEREKQFQEEFKKKMQNQLEEEEKQRLREQLQEQREFRRQAQSIRWRNPVQDQNASEVATDSRSYGTEKDTLNCAFFLKTGSCRYGDACSKFHPYPPISTTLLIKNMYDGPGMSEPTDEDNDDDLEHSEEEIKEHFEKFWYDIVPEFKKFGEIEQLRVCRNHSHHLRGNVYIMYRKQEEAVRAFQAFHGRYYAGKKLLIQYSPVVNWKSAVCGLFTRRQCERGKQCNFLHVFSNPNGELEGRERGYRGSRERSERGDRERGERGDRDRNERGERDRGNRERDRDRDRGGERGDRGDRDRGERDRGDRERGDRDRADRGDRGERDRERGDRDKGDRDRGERRDREDDHVDRPVHPREEYEQDGYPDREIERNDDYGNDRRGRHYEREKPLSQSSSRSSSNERRGRKHKRSRSGSVSGSSPEHSQSRSHSRDQKKPRRHYNASEKKQK